MWRYVVANIPSIGRKREGGLLHHAWRPKNWPRSSWTSIRRDSWRSVPMIAPDHLTRKKLLSAGTTFQSALITVDLLLELGLLISQLPDCQLPPNTISILTNCMLVALVLFSRCTYNATISASFSRGISRCEYTDLYLIFAFGALDSSSDFSIKPYQPVMWLSCSNTMFNVFNDRIEFVFFCTINHIWHIVTNHRFVSWDNRNERWIPEWAPIQLRYRLYLSPFDGFSYRRKKLRKVIEALAFGFHSESSRNFFCFATGVNLQTNDDTATLARMCIND